MAKPKKKKKQKRAVKASMPAVDVTPGKENPFGSGYTGINYTPSDPSEFYPPLATGAITPDNNPALFAMPTGMGLKMLNQYRKSLSKPAFDLIKKKIIDKTPYGVIANLIEGAIAAFPSSEDEEQTPPELYKGGVVKPIKRKR
jgi:hypothetical protein